MCPVRTTHESLVLTCHRQKLTAADFGISTSNTSQAQAQHVVIDTIGIRKLAGSLFSFTLLSQPHVTLASAYVPAETNRSTDGDAGAGPVDQQQLRLPAYHDGRRHAECAQCGEDG